MMKKIDINFLEPPEQQLNSLLKYYQTGQYDDAEKLSLSITQEFPEHLFAWKVLAGVLMKTGRISESLITSQKIMQLNLQDPEAHNNLGVILQKLGRLNEAETSYRQAITLKPDFTEAYDNLGVILQKLGRLDEAEASFRQAIILKPDFTEAHYNLGVILQKLGRLNEAETSYRKAIELKPDHVEAHNNLGVILQQFGRLNEAETSYRKTIELKPDHVEAHNNLGVMLQELGRLDEAEASFRQAITLKPDYAEAYSNLGNILKKLDKLDEAEASYRQAITLKPDFTDAHENLNITVRQKLLLHKIFYKKKTMGKDKTTDINSDIRLTFNPFISHRDVEIELLKKLYRVNFKKIDVTETKDGRYGNGRCSDFEFFENDSAMIKTVEEDLISIMKQAVKSDIYIMESFLNIFGAGSGTIPHKHISGFDKINNLFNQKFSLTYYLSVGDQNCSEPGNLKVYEPSDEILLSNGMIVILPADTMHSAVYNGKKDRVMIGVNFYSLI
jgi:Flp pilus assembly protein TadD